MSDREDQAAQLADIYGVNVEWLTGEAPQHDYEVLKGVRGADNLSAYDRDMVAEFAASMPRGKGDAAERLRRLKAQGRR